VQRKTNLYSRQLHRHSGLDPESQPKNAYFAPHFVVRATMSPFATLMNAPFVHRTSLPRDKPLPGPHSARATNILHLTAQWKSDGEMPIILPDLMKGKRIKEQTNSFLSIDKMILKNK